MSRARFRRRTVGLAVGAASLALSLVVAEGAARIFLEPGNFLKAELIADDALGFQIRPRSAGHDAWGHRNRRVPEHADVVAIGDSQTYGWSALRRDAWPSVLQRLTGKSVYNLSLGGYGPAEYLHLLDVRALDLVPEIVIVGLYYGNDLLDAYVSVYTRDHWKRFRDPSHAYRTPDHVSGVDLRRPADKGGFRTAKSWLKRHSLFYAAADAVSDELARRLEARIDSGTDADYVRVADEEHDVYTTLTPRKRLSAVNLSDDRVREGLRVTLELLAAIERLCGEEGVELLVLLIPTKESVLAEYAGGADPGAARVLRDLLRNEREVGELVKTNLDARGVRHLDLLGPLRKAADTAPLYPVHYDGHPNRNGYRVIARTVSREITSTLLGGR